LFICGGSFDGLKEVVERRVNAGNNRLGFLAGARSEDQGAGALGSGVTPDDLLEFGFIPEMVGRLPVTVTLDHLDKVALVRVLTEPRNAIVKQYEHLFQMDGVELEFTPGALEAAAERAMEHRTGARYLRYVIEDTLLDVMYELPSLNNAVRCVVDRENIEGLEPPKVLSSSGGDVSLPPQPIRKSA
jgi:ATP-dependent Clp protease ATP-binding subunit ClpX